VGPSYAGWSGEMGMALIAFRFYCKPRIGHRVAREEFGGSLMGTAGHDGY